MLKTIVLDLRLLYNYFRWKHTPLDEALMFQHEEVAQLIRRYMDEHPDDFASR
jgi:hypothetical protein